MNIKSLGTQAALFTVLTFISGCVFAQSPPPTTIDHPTTQSMNDDVTKDEYLSTDTRITSDVKAKLAETRDVNGMSISVNTQDGVVSLSGTLASESAIKNAEAAARSVDGVKDVNITGLTAGPHISPGDETADHSSSMGEAFSDSWITGKVKAELAVTKDVNSMDISVKTVDGVVSLTGIVATDAELRKAESGARSVKGVKHVDVSGLKTET